MQIINAGYGHANGALFEQILSRPVFAHLATQSAVGPRESPVWFLWESGAVWIIANLRDSLLQRVSRDERCAIGIVDFDAAEGRVWHAGMRGTATIEPWEPERARRLLARYLGVHESQWDERFRNAAADRSNRWIRFEPVTAVVRDQSYRSVLNR